VDSARPGLSFPSGDSRLFDGTRKERRFLIRAVARATQVANVALHGDVGADIAAAGYDCGKSAQPPKVACPRLCEQVGGGRQP
jgi:hypothetical protein